MNPTAPQAQAHQDAGSSERDAQKRIAPVAGKLRGNVLHALVDAADLGCTAVEATIALGYDLDKLYSIAPRLPELVRDGYAAVAGRRGDRQVYVVTDAGRAWAETAVAA